MHQLVCILALLLQGCSIADLDQDDAFRILFIGNSLTYTNDLPAVVEAMTRADSDRPIVIGSVTYPNFSLEDHWREGTARARLADGDWDVVVMQQGPSSLPENQIHLRTWAARFADEARQFGTKPAMFTVWPAAIHSAGFPAVVEAYAAAADAVDGILLPAGKAWLLAWEEDPDLALYGPDGFHPGVQGTYLAALVIYGGLFEVPVQDIPINLVIDDDTVIQVPEATAEILKGAARDALLEARTD